MHLERIGSSRHAGPSKASMVVLAVQVASNFDFCNKNKQPYIAITTQRTLKICNFAHKKMRFYSLMKLANIEEMRRENAICSLSLSFVMQNMAKSCTQKQNMTMTKTKCNHCGLCISLLHRCYENCVLHLPVNVAEILL